MLRISFLIFGTAILLFGGYLGSLYGGSFWIDVQAAIQDHSTPSGLSREFLRDSVTAFVSSGLIVSITTVISLFLDRLKDINQFGESRYEFAEFLTGQMRGLGSFIFSNGSHIAFDRNKSAIVDRVAFFEERLTEKFRASKYFLKRGQRHRVELYISRVQDFKGRVAAQAIWAASLKQKFNELSDEAAVVVLILAGARRGKELAGEIKQIRFPNSDRSDEAKELPSASAA